MKREIELEEKLNRQNFVTMLRELADAVESSREYQTKVQDMTVNVPAMAGAMKVEYEEKSGKGEFSLEYKWGGNQQAMSGSDPMAL